MKRARSPTKLCLESTRQGFLATLVRIVGSDTPRMFHVKLSGFRKGHVSRETCGSACTSVVRCGREVNRVFPTQIWPADVPQPGPEQLASLEYFLTEVLEANQELNVTGVSDPTEAWVLHVVDSASVVPEIDRAPSGPLADVGSGAGFPGVPLAVLTGRRTTLVESRQKKAAFLVRETAHLPQRSMIEVAAMRAEELAVEHGREYAVVTARAVAQLPTLVELASPLLSQGGHLVAMKGRPSMPELDAGSAAAALVGMRQLSVRRLSLPGLDAARTVIVYEKTGPSAVALPRRSGMAKKRPLA